MIEEANQAFSNKEFSKALTIYTTALKTCQKSNRFQHNVAPLLFNIAAVYLELMHLDKSVLFLSSCYRSTAGLDFLHTIPTPQQLQKLTNLCDAISQAHNDSDYGSSGNESVLSEDYNSNSKFPAPERKRKSNSSLDVSSMASKRVKSCVSRSCLGKEYVLTGWSDDENRVLCDEVRKMGGKIPKWYERLAEMNQFKGRTPHSINSQYNQLLRQMSPLIDEETLDKERSRRKKLKEKQQLRIKNGERPPLKSEDNGASPLKKKEQTNRKGKSTKTKIPASVAPISISLDQKVTTIN